MPEADRAEVPQPQAGAKIALFCSKSSLQGAPQWVQVVAAEARAKQLQEELTGTYREKSRLAEELVAASRQLQIVRDSNEAQVRAGARPHLLAVNPCSIGIHPPTTTRC